MLDKSAELSYDFPMDTKTLIVKFLQEYDAPTALTGYTYLKDCILQFVETKTAPTNKTLFQDLAERHRTDPDNVERCLRTMVEKMYRNFVAAGLFTVRPTTREFIAKCADLITMGGEPKSAYDVLTRR